MPDQYELRARYAPALVTIVLPIAVFNHFFVSPEFAALVGDVEGAIVFSNLTISAVCLYYFSELGRFVGKNLFENRFFRDESQMPTTDYLMHEDGRYSEDYKQLFSDRVHKMFGLNLPTPEEEDADEHASRARIVEVLALVRSRMKGNEALHRHNIEYGAIRNLVGGSVIGTALCLFNITFFHFAVPSQMAITVSTALLVPYSLLIVLSRVLLGFYGRNYAKILFREYMQPDHHA